MACTAWIGVIVQNFWYKEDHDNDVQMKIDIKKFTLNILIMFWYNVKRFIKT